MVMVCRWGLVLLLLIVIGVVNLYDRAASVCERVIGVIRFDLDSVRFLLAFWILANIMTPICL